MPDDVIHTTLTLNPVKENSRKDPRLLFGGLCHVRLMAHNPYISPLIS